jgi:methyl-accepting chemotaxis protein
MNETTSIILVISVVVSICIFVSPWFLRFWKNSSEIQTTVTTMGIVGTFTGILISLSNFDVANISTTIPQLINGLQLAFLTSIAGIGTSLIVNLFPRFYLIKVGTEEETLSDTELLSAMHAELIKLNNNISGDSDSTLITQIQKLRTSVTDKQDELKKSFDQFAEGMVNSNIDALAEAIDKVMGEFNTTVNEKLGKTFEDFRAAVDNLNQWQAEYKGQIDSQTENMKSVHESLGAVTDSMNAVAESMNEITVIKQKFDELLEQLNAQLQGSLDFSTSMKDLSSELEGSGKMIRDELNEITRGAADEMEKVINKTLADFGSNLASISGKLAEDFERVQQMLENSSNR